MHIGKTMIAGFIATVALSALMIAKMLMGLMPELNAIRMLTVMAHGMLGTPATPIVGWLLHFFIGSVLWGGLFALIGSWLPGGPTGRGVVFGALAWVLMMVLVMPMAGAGLFGLRLGLMAPVMTLLLHLVYGAVLGFVSDRLGHGGEPTHAHA